MEIEIDRIATTPTSLRFGCVVRYSENGPVRFVSAYVNDDALTEAVVVDLMVWCQRIMNRITEGDRATLIEPDASLF